MIKNKVSVIMPCYNHEDFVEQAIESVLNQSYNKFNFYIADDSSTDKSVEKILQYENQVDEIHLFDKNMGGLVRFLITRVDTEYVALLNSDDFWEKDKLEKQLEYMETNADCAACFTWGKQVDKNGNRIDNIKAFREDNRERWDWMRYFYENGNCLAHPSIMIKTSIYKELLKDSNLAFRQIGDYQMWVNLIQDYGIHIIEEELVNFRWHSSEKTINVSAETVENNARHNNEECYLWYETISNMELEYFKRAFKEYLINVAPQTEVELKCEKFFLLVRARSETIRHAAVIYFYDIYKDEFVRNVLEEKYMFNRQDFYHLETEIGMASLFIKYEKLKNINREMGQCIIQANQ